MIKYLNVLTDILTGYIVMVIALTLFKVTTFSNIELTIAGVLLIYYFINDILFTTYVEMEE